MKKSVSFLCCKAIEGRLHQFVSNNNNEVTQYMVFLWYCRRRATLALCSSHAFPRGHRRLLRLLLKIECHPYSFRQPTYRYSWVVGGQMGSRLRAFRNALPIVILLSIPCPSTLSTGSSFLPSFHPLAHVGIFRPTGHSHVNLCLHPPSSLSYSSTQFPFKPLQLYLFLPRIDCFLKE